MRRRGRWLVAAVAVLLCAGLLGGAVWTDVHARTRTRNEKAALASAEAHLAALRQQVKGLLSVQAETTSSRNKLESSIQVTAGQLWNLTVSLNGAKATAFVQGAAIGTLQTCLGGIQNAVAALHDGNNTQATQDISAVADACTQLEGGISSGLAYPYNFPDPDVRLFGSTYYAYSTNSVSGSIQIIDSTDLTHWNALGDALQQLPSWASAFYTWHPSVAFIGGKYDLYYAVDPTGSKTDCISVATSSSPSGPFVDSSSGPLQCQPTLGGSIDPNAFIDTNGAVYLLWKSGATGNARLWVQQLDPSGTMFAAGTNPVALLTPDQAWEGGNIEAPDLVAAGGRYLLFYSGNDWDSANYAEGVATCAGPLGPCSDLSPSPILASGNGVSGPGAASVFADRNGNFWIAFDGWDPTAVGGSNNRSLYLRTLDLSGLPSPGAPA
jgi:hypothetical protein